MSIVAHSESGSLPGRAYRDCDLFRISLGPPVRPAETCSRGTCVVLQVRVDVLGWISTVRPRARERRPRSRPADREAGPRSRARPGRRRRRHVARVHGVERGEVGDVRVEDRRLDQVVHRRPRRLQDRGKVAQRELRLRLDPLATARSPGRCRRCRRRRRSRPRRSPGCRGPALPAPGRSPRTVGPWDLPTTADPHRTTACPAREGSAASGGQEVATSWPRWNVPSAPERLDAAREPGQGAALDLVEEVVGLVRPGRPRSTRVC